MLDASYCSLRLASLKKYFRAAAFAPNTNGSLVALSIDTVGNDMFDIRLLQLSSNTSTRGVLLPTIIPNASTHIEARAWMFN